MDKLPTSTGEFRRISGTHQQTLTLKILSFSAEGITGKFSNSGSYLATGKDGSTVPPTLW